jgi:multimeric flavodoxin WrbA
MVKILGLSGSPRAGGNTDTLLIYFLKGAEEAGAQTEIVFLREYLIHPCTGCEQCRKYKVCNKLYDGMQLLYPKIEEAKGMILGSPTHSYNVTAWVKSFLDRLYAFHNFSNDHPRNHSSRLEGQGRKAIVFCVCEQEDLQGIGVTIEAMHKPLTDLGYQIVKSFPVTGYYERGAVRHNKEVLEAAFHEGNQLAQKLVDN